MKTGIWLSILTLAACQPSGCEEDSPRGSSQPADGGVSEPAADANLKARDTRKTDTVGLDRVDPSRFSSDATISVISVSTADAANIQDGGPFSDYDGGTGALNCVQTVDCIIGQECQPEDNICLNGCYGQGTSEAQRLTRNLAVCLLDHCQNLLSYKQREDLNRCASESCPDQLSDCLGDTSGGKG